MSDGFKLARPGIGRGRKSSLESDEGLPQAIWSALNIGRENKALIVAKGGAIINVNELASQLCGLTPEQLLGGCSITQFLQCSRHPAAMMRRWETELTTASRVRIPVEVTYEPLRTDLHELEVYAIRDLRERREAAAQIENFNARLQQQHDLLKEQERQLRAQNVQLDAALNNIVQGLAMFDAEHRLVLCNRRYAEIYGLSADQVQLGTTLLEIIRHRVGNRLLSDMSPEAIVDAMLRRRNDSHFDEFYSQLSDGRCIAVTVQPMADGGTVSTHKDITEQRR
jgi:PAS domain-containing protein